MNAIFVLLVIAISIFAGLALYLYTIIETEEILLPKYSSSLPSFEYNEQFCDTVLVNVWKGDDSYYLRYKGIVHILEDKINWTNHSEMNWTKYSVMASKEQEE